MVQALLDLLVRERQEAPSPQLYLALILANTSPQHGSLEEVSKLLQEIEQSGTLLDSAMYHAVLKVHTLACGFFESAMLTRALTGPCHASQLHLP